METLTKDFSKFGTRELHIAGELLTAFKSSNDKTEYLGEKVEVWFNLMSGYVFLSDEDCNVGMLDGDTLKDFLTCPECGDEGFIEELTCECHKEIFASN